MKNRKLLSIAIFVLLVSMLIGATACRHVDFSKDPVKWTYVSGDGNWDANTRKWTVFLAPGETKSILIKLDNTGADTTVFTQPEGPTNDHIHPNGQQIVNLFPGGSIEITFTAAADTGAPSGSRRYVIDYSYSTTDPNWGKRATAVNPDLTTSSAVTSIQLNGLTTGKFSQQRAIEIASALVPSGVALHPELTVSVSYGQVSYGVSFNTIPLTRAQLEQAGWAEGKDTIFNTSNSPDGTFDQLTIVLNGDTGEFIRKEATTAFNTGGPTSTVAK
jgi:hypothetical protein